MSIVISKTLLSLAVAAGAVVSTTAIAGSPNGQATIAHNEQVARDTIVQPLYATPKSTVERAHAIDTRPATLADNESAARRAIIDPPVSRGVQAVERSRGQKATLSQNEHAARRAISSDVRDREVDEATTSIKRVSTR